MLRFALVTPNRSCSYAFSRSYSDVLDKGTMPSKNSMSSNKKDSLSRAKKSKKGHLKKHFWENLKRFLKRIYA